jgi:hypothetical protein
VVTQNLQLELHNCSTVSAAKGELNNEINKLFQDVFIQNCLVVLKYDASIEGYQADVSIAVRENSTGKREYEYKVNNIWIASYRKKLNDTNRAVYTAPFFINVNDITLQLVLYISTKGEESIITSGVVVNQGEERLRAGFHHIYTPNLFRGSQGITYLDNRILTPQGKSFDSLLSESIARYYEKAETPPLEVTDTDLLLAHEDLITNINQIKTNE